MPDWPTIQNRPWTDWPDKYHSRTDWTISDEEWPDWPEWGTSYTCRHQTSKANLMPTCIQLVICSYLVACQRHVCYCIVIAGCPMLPHSMLLPSVPILILFCSFLNFQPTKKASQGECLIGQNSDKIHEQTMARLTRQWPDCREST